MKCNYKGKIFDPKKMTVAEALQEGILMEFSIHDKICGLYRGRKGWEEQAKKPFVSVFGNSLETLYDFISAHQDNSWIRNGYVMLLGNQIYVNHILKKFWVKTQYHSIQEICAFDKTQVRKFCSGMGKVYNIVEVK